LPYEAGRPQQSEVYSEVAMHATKAAVEEGILLGGGVALLRCQKALEAVKVEGDMQIGVNIVRRALKISSCKVIEALDDFRLMSRGPSLTKAPLVFIGYGISEPDHGWDDRPETGSIEQRQGI
jgi:hypothetical protein